MHTSTKIALVTGAAKRLGRSIALRLAQDGWDIGVHYGQSVAEAQETVLAVQALGRRAVALQADFAQQTQVDSLIEQCTSALGLPDCIVNSASLFAFDNAEDFSPEQFKTHMQINVIAPIALSRDLYRARLHAK